MPYDRSKQWSKCTRRMRASPGRWSGKTKSSRQPPPPHTHTPQKIHATQFVFFCVYDSMISYQLIADVLEALDGLRVHLPLCRVLRRLTEGHTFTRESLCRSNRCEGRNRLYRDVLSKRQANKSVTPANKSVTSAVSTFAPPTGEDVAEPDKPNINSVQPFSAIGWGVAGGGTDGGVNRKPTTVRPP